MWRGEFEGEGRYYSPLGACPLQRGRRRTAGRLQAWTLPGPGNPNKRGVRVSVTAGRGFVQSRSDGAVTHKNPRVTCRAGKSIHIL